MGTAARNASPQSKPERESLWRRLVRRWRSSGLTQADFCRRQRLSIPAFRWWKQELDRRDARRHGSSAGTAHFLPVKVVSPSDSVSSGNGGLVELELNGGRILRVRPGFDPDLLVKIISAVEAAS